MSSATASDGAGFGSTLLTRAPFVVLGLAVLYRFWGEILSFLVDQYLKVRFPITHEKSGKTIPSTSFEWPDGQGNVAKLLEGDKNSPKWNKQFGSVYRVWSGMHPEVILTEPEDVQRIFKDAHRHTKANSNNSGWLMEQILGSCVGLISHERWRTLRGIAEKPFLKPAVVSQTPAIEKIVEQHFKEFSQKTSAKNGVLHPVEDFKLLPFLIVAQIVYGELDKSDRDELVGIVPNREKLFEVMINGGIHRFAWAQILPTETMRMLRQFKSQWSDFNDRMYKKALNSGVRQPIVDFYDQVDAGVVSRENILQTLDEVLFANLDVTIGGLSWNMVFLSVDSKFQEKLRAEVNNQKKNGTEAEWFNYLNKSNTLLWALPMEASRIKPVGAFTTPSAAPDTRVAGGYKIPGGTDYVVDSYALNVRNKSWGPDAETFRPERFLEGEAVDRYGYWRFGFGPRQCIGKHVADAVIKQVVSTLMLNYRLSPVAEDYNWDRKPGVWITQPASEIRCKPL